MAKRLQHRGGTTSQHSTFTGAVREVTVDTDKNTLVVHDGATAGGHPLATATNFTSTGIDDNATSTAITIGSDERVHINGTAPQSGVRINPADETSGLNIYKTTEDASISLFRNDTSTVNGEIIGSLRGLVNDNNSSGFYERTGEIDFIASSTHTATIRNTDIVFKTMSGTTLLQKMRIAYNGDISFYEDTGTTPKFFWDASAERLGIGTTSSVGKFHIQSSDQNHIYLNGTSGDAYGLWVTPTGTNFNLGTWSGRETIKIDGDGNTIQFETDSSERMRIDSSGNVLINTTDASTLTAGIKLRASDNAIAAVVTSNPSGYFGRLSTDGEIVKFRRDSTTVGGIGSRSGTSNIYIESASSGRLRANGVDVAGWNSSTGTFFSATDNGNDLGTNVNRWKDLYLGGGLYVGGIGTANKLDDYEEGTFTPSFSSGNGFGSLSYVFQRGTYTKIGRIVNIRIQIELGSGVTKNGNRIIMDGLPFTSSSALPGTGLNWSYVNSKVIGSTTTNIPTLWVTSNNNSIQWYKTDGSDFTGNDISGSTTNMDIYINGTYQTDA